MGSCFLWVRSVGCLLLSGCVVFRVPGTPGLELGSWCWYTSCVADACEASLDQRECWDQLYSIAIWTVAACVVSVEVFVFAS